MPLTTLKGFSVSHLSHDTSIFEKDDGNWRKYYIVGSDKTVNKIIGKLVADYPYDCYYTKFNKIGDGVYEGERIIMKALTNHM